jgi:hypothetical protein
MSNYYDDYMDDYMDDYNMDINASRKSYLYQDKQPHNHTQYPNKNEQYPVQDQQYNKKRKHTSSDSKSRKKERISSDINKKTHKNKKAKNIYTMKELLAPVISGKKIKINDDNVFKLNEEVGDNKGIFTEEIDFLNKTLESIVEKNKINENESNEELRGAKKLYEQMIETIRESQNKIKELEKKQIDENERVQREFQEAAQMCSELSEAMATTSSELTPRQRKEILEKHMNTIAAMLNNMDKKSHKKQKNYLVNFKQDAAKILFDEIIKVYTEMSSYAYTNPGEILAKFGAAIAGTAMIGSTVYSLGSSNITNPAEVLISLASRFPKSTAVISGLYCLNVAGLTIPQPVVNCVKTSCTLVQQNLKSVVKSSFNLLKDYVSKKLTDDYSSITISSDSTSSRASTASTTGEAIAEILNTPLEEQRLVVYNEQQPKKSSSISSHSSRRSSRRSSSRRSSSRRSSSRRSSSRRSSSRRSSKRSSRHSSSRSR